MSRVRKPGQGFELTEDELLSAPARMLTPEQKKQRIAINKRESDRRRSEARVKRMASGKAQLIFCSGENSKGDPCSRPCMEGAKHCYQHLTYEEQIKLKVVKKHKPKKEVGALNTTPNAVATMRNVVETAIDKIVGRYFAALGLKFVGFDEDGDAVVQDLGMDQGLVLHSASKDGVVKISKFPDLAAQVAVMEKLLDRVYGKPKQTQVLEGGVKPVQVEPTRTADRAIEVASLLQKFGAIPNENSTADTPADTPDATPNEEVPDGDTAPHS